MTLSRSCLSVTTSVSQVFCTGTILEVSLNDGRNLYAPLRAFPGLAEATPAQRDNWILSDNGRTLAWPELGKHFSLEEIVGAARMVD